MIRLRISAILVWVFFLSAVTSSLQAAVITPSGSSGPAGVRPVAKQACQAYPSVLIDNLYDTQGWDDVMSTMIIQKAYATFDEQDYQDLLNGDISPLKEPVKEATQVMGYLLFNHFLGTGPGQGKYAPLLFSFECLPLKYAQKPLSSEEESRFIKIVENIVDGLLMTSVAEAQCCCGPSCGCGCNNPPEIELTTNGFVENSPSDWTNSGTLSGDSLLGEFDWDAYFHKEDDSDFINSAFSLFGDGLSLSDEWSMFVHLYDDDYGLEFGDGVIVGFKFRF